MMRCARLSLVHLRHVTFGNTERAAMASTTPEAAVFARVVAATAGILSVAGFKKRRASFNRATPDGLVHVVWFWMAPKEPPAWTEIPGFRERLYGTFRPEFGVYVPEMRRSGSPKADWINAYNCQLRRTVGQLMGAPGDLWWSLGDEGASDLAQSAVMDFGLPWLDTFPDREAILEHFRISGPTGIGMSPAGDLDVGEMLASLGRHAEARTVLEHYVDRGVSAPHAGYLASYLPAVGYADLVPRVRIK